MSRADLLKKIQSLLKDQLVKDSIISLKLITDSALYIIKSDCKLGIKLEVISTKKTNEFDALQARVISRGREIDVQVFKFSLMEKKLTRPDAVDSELHLWTSFSGQEDWYTTEPVSYEPLIEEIVSFCKIWHNLS